MLRFRQADLEKWYQQAQKKPLILRGARQVGKSFLVRDFAKKNSIALHEINLEKHKHLSTAITKVNTSDFIQEVQLICNQGSLNTPHSVLFIDEIQAIPEALHFLRYLYEDNPELPIICAGSLLEFVLRKNTDDLSMPVGRVEYCYLGPCTFKEFLNGIKETQLLDYLSSYKIGDKFSEVAHQKLNSLLRTYKIVGGMPEALQKYIDTKDLAEVMRIHTAIMSTYRDDFAKYSERISHQTLQKVIDFIPVGLGRKVKYSNIDPALKSAELKAAIELLEMAGLIMLAYVSDATRPPLGASKNFSVFKPYFLDCGLLNCIAGLNSPHTEKLMNEDDLSEQIIAQHLKFLGEFYRRNELFYWLREGKSNNAEVDFITQHTGKIVPLEVKSGSVGKLKSVHQFLARGNLDLAVRFNLDPPAVEEFEYALTSGEKNRIRFKLISLPVYLVEEVERVLA